MNTIGKLFYDDEFEALRHVIESSDFEYKHVASHMWPDMKPESAYAKLKACVSGRGDERLKFGQIIELCRYCKRFDALYFMADSLGHDRPTERTPENQAELLLRSINDKMGDLQDLKRQLERIAPGLKVVA